MAASRLQREIKKKHPFGSPEQEAMLNLLRSSDRFNNRFHRLFREYGLTASQYNVLRILQGEGQPLPSLEIADRMIQAVPAITGLIDRLEAASLVSRHRCEHDRRVVYVELTEQGTKLLSQLDAPVSDLHKSLLGHLTRAELKELIRLMEKARTSVDETH